MSLRYINVKNYVQAALVERAFSPMPVISPGPAGNLSLQKTPQALVFLTVGGGAAMTEEQLFETPFITLHVWGRQHDYDSAENVALTINEIMVAYNDKPSQTMDGVKVTGVSLAGGRPQLVDFDDADRYHFSCSYIVESQFQ